MVSQPVNVEQDKCANQDGRYRADGIEKDIPVNLTHLPMEFM